MPTRHFGPRWPEDVAEFIGESVDTGVRLLFLAEGQESPVGHQVGVKEGDRSSLSGHRRVTTTVLTPRI